MKKFQVGVGRKVTQYLDVVVEADDRDTAVEAAKSIAEIEADPAAWQPGDAELYETTVEDAAADTPTGVWKDLPPVRAFWQKDPTLEALMDEQMTGPSPCYIVLADDRTIILADGGRELFVSLDASPHGTFTVSTTSDPMALLDPDGVVDLQSSHATVQDAFAAACGLVGLDYRTEPAPSP
jgi:hypothetical protein